MQLLPKFSFAGLLLASLFSCATTKPDKQGVELAMRRYDGLIKKVDAEAIALLFTPDGNLGNVAIGRDSIRRFLDRFKSMKVLRQQSTTTGIDMKGDTSFQTGYYQQTVIISAKDTISVHGDYKATWLWSPPNGWLLKKMITMPKK